MNILPSPFKSLKGKAEYLAAYDAMMQYWPVPYRIVRHSRIFRLHSFGCQWPKRRSRAGIVARRARQPHHVVRECG